MWEKKTRHERFDFTQNLACCLVTFFSFEKNPSSTPKEAGMKTNSGLWFASLTKTIAQCSITTSCRNVWPEMCPLPTYAKWGDERKKAQNMEKVVLVNQGMGVHITNSPRCGGISLMRQGLAGSLLKLFGSLLWVLTGDRLDCYWIPNLFADLELKHIDAVSRGGLCCHCPG